MQLRRQGLTEEHHRARDRCCQLLDLDHDQRRTREETVVALAWDPPGSGRPPASPDRYRFPATLPAARSGAVRPGRTRAHGNGRPPAEAGRAPAHNPKAHPARSPWRRIPARRRPWRLREFSGHRSRRPTGTSLRDQQRLPASCHWRSRPRPSPSLSSGAGSDLDVDRPACPNAGAADQASSRRRTTRPATDDRNKPGHRATGTGEPCRVQPLTRLEMALRGRHRQWCRRHRPCGHACPCRDGRVRTYRDGRFRAYCGGLCPALASG